MRPTLLRQSQAGFSTITPLTPSLRPGPVGTQHKGSSRSFLLQGLCLQKQHVRGGEYPSSPFSVQSGLSSSTGQLAQADGTQCCSCFSLMALCSGGHVPNGPRRGAGTPGPAGEAHNQGPRACVWPVQPAASPHLAEGEVARVQRGRHLGRQRGDGGGWVRLYQQHLSPGPLDWPILGPSWRSGLWKHLG